MADDEAESNEKAALARLRMFLAPHAPLKSADHVHEAAVNEQVDSTEPSNCHGDHEGDDTVKDDEATEAAADLSTLAEQFTASDDAQDPASQPPLDAHDEAQAEEARPIDRTAHDEDGAMNDTTALHTAPAAGTVASVSPLTTTSKEFMRVKFLLQYSLPGFRVHDDLLVWDMQNPELVMQYEAHAAGLLELDSWVEVDNLSAAMGDIQAYGFAQVGEDQTAMKFTTGDLAMDPMVNKKGRKQLVLCKIAVGRSLLIQHEDQAKTKPLPPGYHSYHIGQQETADEDTVNGLYSHQYILNDALQILPQYLVRFSYSAVEGRASHMCALCEKHASTLVCKSCDAELCSNCDQEVHSANKLVERHKRVPRRDRGDGVGDASGRTRRRSSTPRSVANIDGGADSNQSAMNEAMPEGEVDIIVAKQIEESMADFQTTCKLHVAKRIEFFCPICAVPVCVNCKMVGDHSVGDKGSHRLLSLTDAYERSLRESFKSDPLVESRKSVIDSKLATIATAKIQLLRNREAVEAAIKQQYEQALAQLGDQMQVKMNVLDGEALEFRRQLQQIDWLDDCLEDQRASCSVIDFLSTWNHHKSLRAEQRDFPPAHHAPVSGEHVNADLQLVGCLQVVSGDQVGRTRSFSRVDASDLHQESDSYRSTSPRGSTGASRTSVASVRRTSDSEIRRKLLSMRTIDPKEPDSHTSEKSMRPSNSSMGTLSAQGMKMMAAIRNDLLTKGTISSTGSPRRTPFNPTTTATLRAFSIQPARSMAPKKIVSTGTNAWTSLLRQELGVAKQGSE